MFSTPNFLQQPLNQWNTAQAPQFASQQGYQMPQIRELPISQPNQNFDFSKLVQAIQQGMGAGQQFSAPQISFNAPSPQQMQTQMPQNFTAPTMQQLQQAPAPQQSPQPQQQQQNWSNFTKPGGFDKPIPFGNPTNSNTAGLSFTKPQDIPGGFGAGANFYNPRL